MNWKLALKVGETSSLGFSSPLWTNTALLNEASPVGEMKDAKYSQFNTEPFKRIRMCVGSPESNCVTHVFSQRYDSAKALFSAGYIRDESVDKDGLLRQLRPRQRLVPGLPDAEAREHMSTRCFSFRFRCCRCFCFRPFWRGLASTSSAETATKLGGVSARTARISVAKATTTTMRMPRSALGSRDREWTRSLGQVGPSATTQLKSNP